MVLYVPYTNVTIVDGMLLQTQQQTLSILFFPIQVCVSDNYQMSFRCVSRPAFLRIHVQAVVESLIGLSRLTAALPVALSTSGQAYQWLRLKLLQLHRRLILRLPHSGIFFLETGSSVLQKPRPQYHLARQKRFYHSRHSLPIMRHFLLWFEYHCKSWCKKNRDAVR